MKKIVSAALMTLAVGGASAQAYVGGSFGATEFNMDCYGSETCDKSGTGFKIYGGYHFHKNFAIEGGYIDFGSAKVTGYDYYYGYIDGTIESNALFLGVALRGEFAPKVSGVLRAGVAMMETKVSGSVGYYSGSSSETGAKPLLGLGLEFAATPQLKVTLDADFSDSAEYGSDSGALRLLSLGARFSF